MYLRISAATFSRLSVWIDVGKLELADMLFINVLELRNLHTKCHKIFGIPSTILMTSYSQWNVIIDMDGDPLLSLGFEMTIGVLFSHSGE